MHNPGHESFQLLGLLPGASSEEIKRAFRRLAMQWHPDRNGDPRATDRFKLLREAYEDLIGMQDAGAADGETVRPTSGKRDRRRDPPRPRAPDRRRTLEVGLEDAYLGCDSMLWIENESSCPDCDGRGWQTRIRGRLCEDCHGSGRLRTATGLGICGACAGRGYRYREECTTCAGSGRTVSRVSSNLRVPPGTCDRTELRVAGGGEPGSDGLADGDLLVTVRITPHPLYRIDGRDLVIRRPVGALRMLLGGEIVLPHPRGRLRLSMSPGPARSRQWCLEGAGWPASGKHAAGVFRVELHPVMPENLASLQELLEPLVEAVEHAAGEHQSEVALWEGRWLD